MAPQKKEGCCSEDLWIVKDWKKIKLTLLSNRISRGKTCWKEIRAHLPRRRQRATTNKKKTFTGTVAVAYNRAPSSLKHVRGPIPGDTINGLDVTRTLSHRSRTRRWIWLVTLILTSSHELIPVVEMRTSHHDSWKRHSNTQIYSFFWTTSRQRRSNKTRTRSGRGRWRSHSMA